jgi:hypothetical protein
LQIANIILNKSKQGVVVHTYNPSTLEVEVGSQWQEAVIITLQLQESKFIYFRENQTVT